ncbi:MAG TPA: lasso peptide biosynthesis B2 protein [Planctomycetota bacterium]|nr:lasso peptide biosynthesis B2 protein [Planctomycetota bacterium]
MFSKLKRFFNADGADRSALARAWFVLVGARALLWIFPFERVMSLVPARTQDVQSPPDWITAGRLSWAVQVASGYVPVATCLSQALALQYLLNREGIGAELKIGVARGSEGEVAAHAWVESHGRVLIGSLPDLFSYGVLRLKNRR